MRGLTALERQLLAARAADAPRAEFAPDTAGYRAYAELQKVGRMRVVEEQDWIVNHITDLGRLALRVCPPEDT